ncbi:hypothetical protein EV193_10956 [Herbihabitans rhizosphaerae]|uniref:Uncharacterized protein n=1 Tax=Herbihabitans rhizosphaerae TaxID=1872711 RepID=A0A4Q7KGL8_9PSEU|nr:hypothetical protein [Herbihabitans rhizosphaerae]RZS34269.1 hypothetical protein EV193_10956 [Herbihabitans rhizosphaerae]
MIESPGRTGWRNGIIAAGLLVLAAGLVVWTTFTDLVTVDTLRTSGGRETGTSRTLGMWGTDTVRIPERPNGTTHDTTMLGLVALAAAALLVICAVLLLIARTGRGPGIARLLTGIATGATVGMALLVMLLVTFQHSQTNEAMESGSSSSQRYEASTGLGLWLLIIAGVATLAALVLALTGRTAPATETKPGSVGSSVLSGLLLLAAAGLVIGGSFGALFSFSSERRGSTSGFSRSLWSVTQTSSRGDRTNEIAQFGVAAIVAAVLLVVAAALAVLSAYAVSSRQPARSGRLIGTVGFGILVATVLTVTVASIEALVDIAAEDVSPGETVNASLGLGSYLLFGALVVAVVGIVFGPRALPVGGPQWTQMPDTPTPPMGVPITQSDPTQPVVAQPVVAQEDPPTEPKPEPAPAPEQQEPDATPPRD